MVHEFNFVALYIKQENRNPAYMKKKVDELGYCFGNVTV